MVSKLGRGLRRWIKIDLVDRGLSNKCGISSGELSSKDWMNQVGTSPAKWWVKKNAGVERQSSGTSWDLGCIINHQQYKMDLSENCMFNGCGNEYIYEYCFLHYLVTMHSGKPFGQSMTKPYTWKLKHLVESYAREAGMNAVAPGGLGLVGMRPVVVELWHASGSSLAK